MARHAQGARGIADRHQPGAYAAAAQRTPWRAGRLWYRAATVASEPQNRAAAPGAVGSVPHSIAVCRSAGRICRESRQDRGIPDRQRGNLRLCASFPMIGATAEMMGRAFPARKIRSWRPGTCLIPEKQPATLSRNLKTFSLLRCIMFRKGIPNEKPLIHQGLSCIDFQISERIRKWVPNPFLPRC